jgi:hypothetical protein
MLSILLRAPCFCLKMPQLDRLARFLGRKPLYKPGPGIGIGIGDRVIVYWYSVTILAAGVFRAE